MIERVTGGNADATSWGCAFARAHCLQHAAGALVLHKGDDLQPCAVPGRRQFDLALRRQFNLTERLNLQFRLEAFNVFNHANFARPVADISNPLFGQATSMFSRGLGSGGTTSGLNPLYQVGGPRSLQLSLKLNF